jgi:hypothetical protein
MQFCLPDPPTGIKRILRKQAEIYEAVRAARRAAACPIQSADWIPVTLMDASDSARRPRHALPSDTGVETPPIFFILLIDYATAPYSVVES